MFFSDDKRTCGVNEIGEKLFDSSGMFVAKLIDAGRFVPESWRTPGNRGKRVWLVVTVEKWFEEYRARFPDKSETTNEKEHRAALNEAAEQATRIAAQYDAEVQSKLFARSEPGRESKVERDSTKMVATA